MSLLSGHALYILIDDDPTHNDICGLMIRNTIKDSEVIAFEEGVNALHYLATNLASDKQKSAVLLLNLNMPSMSGWEFLDRFATLDKSLRDRFRIYILTSSIDESDRLRSIRSEHVAGFFAKPLSSQTILSL